MKEEFKDRAKAWLVKVDCRTASTAEDVNPTTEGTSHCDLDTSS